MSRSQLLEKGQTSRSYEYLYIYSIVTGDVCISNNCLPHHSSKRQMQKKKILQENPFSPKLPTLISWFGTTRIEDVKNKSPWHMLEAHLQVQSTMWVSSFAAFIYILGGVVLKYFLTSIGETIVFLEHKQFTCKKTSPSFTPLQTNMTLENPRLE